MKKLKRMISAILLLCMILTCMPPVQIVSAAPQYEYVLDTDGIDVGDEVQYLIVSGTGTTAYAMDPTGSSGGVAREVSVVGGTNIASFDGVADCLWTFEEVVGGYYLRGSNNKYLRFPNSANSAMVYQTAPFTIVVKEKDNGYNFCWSNFYVEYKSSAKKFRSTKTDTVLYLFKKQEVKNNYKITFNANTEAEISGTMPGEVNVPENGTYIIPESHKELSYTANGDRYLFLCWSDSATGEGNQYYPGNEIAVSGNLTLYAQWEKEVKYTVTFDGNGNTSGSVPDSVTLPAGSTYTIPAPGDDFRMDFTFGTTVFPHVFQCWMDDLSGNGKDYIPGETITVQSNLTLYARWVQRQEYQAKVTTKLDGTALDLDDILGTTANLVLRLEGSVTDIPLNRDEEGLYTAWVTENGTYTVFIKRGDAVDTTGCTLKITDQSANADLLYYSVTYQADGFDAVNYPAGARVEATWSKPYDPNNLFLGWELQTGNVIAPGGLIVDSIQEKIVLTPKWKATGSQIYTVHFLEKGSYKKIRDNYKVDDVSIGQEVKVSDVKRVLPGFSYAGVEIGGVFYEATEDPVLIIDANDAKNIITLFYTPDPDLHLHKEATLMDDGTYTITMEMFTQNNPVTTIVEQDIPLDIVLVLDQSSSMYNPFDVQNSPYTKLMQAVSHFVDLIADHGRANKIDHRLAIVGYGSDGTTYSAVGDGPVAGDYNYLTTQKTDYTDFPGRWTNTGLFDARGDFHVYPITGFNYTKYEKDLTLKDFVVNENDTETEKTAYYTYADGQYVVLDYLAVYRHMITEHEAYEASLQGTPIYGYVDDDFVLLRRNDSGLWIYNENQLYSEEEFFTRHENVLTHRVGIERREIHAYLVDGKFVSVDDHEGVYVREETTNATPDKSIYADALIPVTMGKNGSGFVDNAFYTAISKLGAAGETLVHYGMKMANDIFEANALEKDDVRQRVVIVFTDGKPGDSINFDEPETNAALEIAKDIKDPNKLNAKIYTVGLYSGADTERTKQDQIEFMQALSSCHPDAVTLDDVWTEVEYVKLLNKNVDLTQAGPYYMQVDGKYYRVGTKSTYVGGAGNLSYVTEFGYYDEAIKNDKGEPILQPVLEFDPNKIMLVVGENSILVNYWNQEAQKDKSGNEIVIYRRAGKGLKVDPETNHYSVAAETPEELDSYFAGVVRTLTTQISEEIWIENNAIMRDIMGQGMVLTPGTVITVYKQAGTFIPDEKRVEWVDGRTPIATLTIPKNPADVLTTKEGVTVDGVFTPYIGVYNLQSVNPTDPTKDNYHPHTVDITGYKFDEWYMNNDKPENLQGYRLVATITRVEARDDVQWGRTTTTNHAQSGLWLHADETGYRHLMEAFVQPTTAFVERAYVLDYGKEFELGGWYFDAENGDAVHADFTIADGMNHFDNNTLTTQNGGSTGNTQYGNVLVEKGQVYYQPTTTQWGGYDQFYVFGNTKNELIISHDANRTGNLWNKVTVIPANNIYYEDSFITGSGDGKNSISGFVYTGAWTTVYTGDDETNGGQNKEDPETMEGTGHGVHGWTDDLSDDSFYTDGSATSLGVNARAEFTFTGTGVDVYTRTNQQSGRVVAALFAVAGDVETQIDMVIMDNLSMSGDYYQIPTISFTDLDYGTYKVLLIATSAGAAATGSVRSQYYLDGIRVYNPLGTTFGEEDHVVKDAYGKEQNAVFTEIRDIMLKYDDFNHGLQDDEQGIMGAVFIDWLGNNLADENNTGKPTYGVGTDFKTYGPKNEVYLSKGQAIVLKVDPQNTYYVGMKALSAGSSVQVSVSGLDRKNPQTITISHSADLYYQVTPVMGDFPEEAYLVIQNTSQDDALLALTKLRTTNMYTAVLGNGVMAVRPKMAVTVMQRFAQRLADAQNTPAQPEVPETTPEPETSAADKILQEQKEYTKRLFTTVRTWLQGEEGGAA